MKNNHWYGITKRWSIWAIVRYHRNGTTTIGENVGYERTRTAAVNTAISLNDAFKAKDYGTEQKILARLRDKETWIPNQPMGTEREDLSAEAEEGKAGTPHSSGD